MFIFLFELTQLFLFGCISWSSQEKLSKLTLFFFFSYVREAKGQVLSTSTIILAPAQRHVGLTQQPFDWMAQS